MKTLAISILAAALALGCNKEDKAQQPNSPEAEKPATPAQPEAEPGAAKLAPGAAAPTAAELGEAPAFALKDLDGNEFSLAQYKGKTVVLEWFNPGCPFVKYAHGEGPLTDQAAKTMKDDVVWLAINSGAPGKQGHGVEVNKKAAEEWSMSHPVLLDESGEVGKAYGAKTTPHMYVVDPAGKLVYRGALDNAPLGEARDGQEVENYVSGALASLAAGQPVDPAETKPYGCGVKYAN